MALWAQVTVTPDDNNKAVLKRGNNQGLIASIPNGGHVDPTQIEGAILE